MSMMIWFRRYVLEPEVITTLFYITKCSKKRYPGLFTRLGFFTIIEVKVKERNQI